MSSVDKILKEMFPEDVNNLVEKLQLTLLELSKHPVLHNLDIHPLKKGGKRLRPLLCLLIQKSFGQANDETVLAYAEAMELVHIASLLHDDVIDNASTRRGKPTVNASSSSKQAILAGDLLLAFALELIHSTHSSDAITFFIEAVKRMTIGEAVELNNTRNPHMSSAECLQVCSDKTAALFKAAAQLGAIAAHCDPRTVEVLGLAGEQLGIAFQIIDDVLDFVGKEENLGKQPFTDLHEGKCTLPVRFTIDQLTNPEQKELLVKSISQPISAENVLEVVNLIKKHGVTPTHQMASSLIAQFAQTIETFLPQGVHKELLLELAEFSKNRLT